MSANANKQSVGSIIWSWLTTVDHKRIGIMYLVGGTLFFVLGGILALLMRLQLMFPENTLVSGATFNEFMTMHGTNMIFLAATPLLFGFINYVMPLQIGARDVAFPFVNALSFWLFLFGGILVNLSWFFGAGADSGWTTYVPLSLPEYSSIGVDFLVLGLQLSGLGTLLSGINFLATIINMRAPGMTLMRMPMFTWTSFVMSGLILFAFPPLTVGYGLLLFDRIFGASFFNVAKGGNVVLWEHIFWIFGHPEVYILVLPAFGMISEIVSTFSKKRIFGYHSMVFATTLIGFLGFMVWAHHMYTVGMGPVVNSLFAMGTILIAVPTGIKVFNWLFTMWGGRLKINTASLFAIFFVPTFVIGGVTGVMMALPALDYQVHDTYFIVAHFHYTIVGGIVMGLFGALYYWWPKMTGRFLNEKLGIVHFITFFIGFHLTFFVQHFLGLMGMPRRVFTFLANQGLDTMNFVSTIGTFLMSFGVIVLVINVALSLIRGEKAPADPWDGRTLEWAISSPPPYYNFEQLPRVRGLDPLFIEKTQGNGKMIPAEPLQPVHMPNGSILPVLMAIALFISGFGFCLHNFYVAAAGIILNFMLMAVRSLQDDHGYHIEVEELEAALKGVE